MICATRARTFQAAAREHAGAGELAVVYASKAFPCTAVLALFAQEGLWCDVASGGELHLALGAGFDPARLVLHGNAKSEHELRLALERGVGLIVVDNFDEIERLRELIGAGALGVRGSQAVLVRATPDVAGETHAKISTGQANSKFGFAMAEVAEASERIERVGRARAAWRCTPTSALSSSSSSRFAGPRRARDGWGVSRSGTWAAGSASRTPRDQRPPAIEEYVRAIAQAAAEHLGEHEPAADRARAARSRRRRR